MFTVPAAAQQTVASNRDRPVLALTVVGLATFQPVDGSFVSENAPYLDRGLGGFGVGAAAELNLFTVSHVSAAVEVSTAAVSAVQHGRLVGGAANGRFRETLVSALAGLATTSHDLQLLAGVSWRGGTPTLNGVAIGDPDAGHAAFTAGAEVGRPIGARTALVAHVRYSVAPRTEREKEIGIGSQIIRAGVGVRVIVAQ
ncbi:MAG TPA: hypothetical protein VG222_04940 [Vicinamibacterales bacterium]|nr:hypothetical protein [Vicinamibacterales bacterium]